MVINFNSRPVFVSDMDISEMAVLAATWMDTDVSLDNTEIHALQERFGTEIAEFCLDNGLDY